MTSSQKLRHDAMEIWNAGVAAVDACKLVRESVSVNGSCLSIGNREFAVDEIERIVVVGFGKASGAMAVGLEQALANLNFDSDSLLGRVNVPSGQTEQSKRFSLVGCRPPGENLPTQEVLDSTEAIIDLVSSAGPADICICLISGGGSALLEKPVDPVSLADLRAATVFLSRAGASIYELNAVRRAISAVKGGKLAMRSGGAPIVTLIVSDVIGDQLEIIASGPTVDSSNGLNPMDVLNRLDPERMSVPQSIWSVVESGLDQGSQTFALSDVSNQVIGNLRSAMQACCRRAVDLGYHVNVEEPSGQEGDAALVGRSVAIQIARSCDQPAYRCEIMGGETTVTMGDSPGRGGRNQHLVLAALESVMQFQLGSESAFCLLSAGTDGEDGNVPVAGAWFDSDWIRAWTETQQQRLLEAMVDSLNRCDSYSLLSEHGLVFEVPPTKTNVCDLRIMLTQSS